MKGLWRNDARDATVSATTTFGLNSDVNQRVTCQGARACLVMDAVLFPGRVTRVCVFRFLPPGTSEALLRDAGGLSGAKDTMDPATQGS